MTSTVSRASVALLVIAAALLVSAPNASAASSYCSPSGDVCYGAFDKGAKVRLRITLMAGYFTRYRLCVRAPSGNRTCHRFRLHRIEHGMYDSQVRWARHFPTGAPGTYRARWSYGAGVNLGPPIRFAAGPSIKTKPKRVAAGQRVRVYGLAGGCPQGDEVTLMSEAFPKDHEFAGIPAVFAKVDRHDSYSVRVRIPVATAAGHYRIGARCGGGNFGVRGSLEVTAPAADAAATRARVSVFFSRGGPGPQCRRVRARPRHVAAPAVLRGALRALLRGPTARERRHRYGGWFSHRTAGRLNGVRLAGGVAHIDFRDFRKIIPNASTSCGSALLLAQLDRTALQFPTVDRAIYSFDGSVKRFYEWLQLTPPSGG